MTSKTVIQLFKSPILNFRFVRFDVQIRHRRIYTASGTQRGVSFVLALLVWLTLPEFSVHVIYSVILSIAKLIQRR